MSATTVATQSNLNARLRNGLKNDNERIPCGRASCLDPGFMRVSGENTLLPREHR